MDRSSSRTSFFRAAYDGDVRELRAIQQQRPGCVQDRDPRFGFTAAHIACSRDHVEVLRALHALGAPLEEGTSTGVPAGLVVFEWRGCAGSTPLHVAAQRGSVECLQQLLEWGVCVDVRDADNRTPGEYLESEEAQRVYAEALAQRDEAQLVQEAREHHERNELHEFVSKERRALLADNRIRVLELVMKQMDHLATLHAHERAGSEGSVFMAEFGELKETRAKLIELVTKEL